MEEWNTESELARVVLALSEDMGGAVSWDRSGWTAYLTFRPARSHERVADDLGRADFGNARFTGRVQLLARLVNGETLPMSKAYERPDDAMVQAADTLLDGLEAYAEKLVDKRDARCQHMGRPHRGPSTQCVLPNRHNDGRTREERRHRYRGRA